MTTNQFTQLMERLDKVEANVDSRLRKLEIKVASVIASVMLTGFLIANGLIRLG